MMAMINIDYLQMVREFDERQRRLKEQQMYRESFSGKMIPVIMHKGEQYIPLKFLEELMAPTDDDALPKIDLPPGSITHLPYQHTRYEIAYNILTFKVLVAMGNSNMDGVLRKELTKALALAAGELT